MLQDELKIDDDCFEDLQSLYKLFDLDKDGILNFKEYEKLLRCLGYRLTGKKNFHYCLSQGSKELRQRKGNGGYCETLQRMFLLPRK